MVFKKKKLNQQVVIGHKEKLSNRVKKKLQNTTKKQRIALLILIFVVFICFVLALYVYGEIRGNNQNVQTPPFEEQEISESTINEALQKLQEDPSAIPSGKFKPELGQDYFINGGGSNQGTIQQ